MNNESLVSVKAPRDLRNRLKVECAKRRISMQEAMAASLAPMVQVLEGSGCPVQDWAKILVHEGVCRYEEIMEGEDGVVVDQTVLDEVLAQVPFFALDEGGVNV